MTGGNMDMQPWDTRAAGQDTRSPRFPEMPTCSELPVSAHQATAEERKDIHIISVVRTYIVRQN